MSSNISDEAIEFLKENRGNIDWKILSGNTNLKAIELLKEHPDKISWVWIGHNQNAIEIIKCKKF